MSGRLEDTANWAGLETSCSHLRDHRCSILHKLALLMATSATDHLKGNITSSRKSPGLSYPINHCDQGSWPVWGAGLYNPDTSRVQHKSWGISGAWGWSHSWQNLLSRSQLFSWHCPACPMPICPARGTCIPTTQPREFLSPSTSPSL